MATDSSQTFALYRDEDGSQHRMKFENWFVVAILIGVALFTGADIFDDVGEGASVLHLIGEGLVAVLAILGAFILWRRSLTLQIQVRKASIEKQEALMEAERWRSEASHALKGLSDAIDAQMSRWSLTKSEKEVALLLLKGLSLKEVAEVRGVSEKTARAQSFAIYSKTGLSGRAALSAFFLEDLMLPN